MANYYPVGSAIEPERDAAKEESRGLLADPAMRALLIQTGISMMQPMQGGFLGGLGQAFGEGLAAAGRVKRLEYERGLKGEELEYERGRQAEQDRLAAERESRYARGAEREEEAYQYERSQRPEKEATARETRDLARRRMENERLQEERLGRGTTSGGLTPSQHLSAILEQIKGIENGVLDGTISQEEGNAQITAKRREYDALVQSSTGAVTGAPSASTTAGQPGVTQPLTPQQQTLVSQAKDALARGWPRAKVEAELQRQGITDMHVLGP